VDYESEQLNAYDSAEMQRYLLGSVKRPEPEQQPEPEMELFGTPMSELEAAGEQVKEDAPFIASEIYKTGTSALRNAGQAGIKYGRDFLQKGGEDFVAQFVGLADGSNLKLSIPAPRLPEVDEPESIAGQLASDFIQFGIGYLASPNKFGVLNPIVRSAIADGVFFDPEEGGFVRPLIDFGILPQATEFLAVDDVNEESSAEERLRARLKLSGQGMLAGAVVDGIIKTLRVIKNDPALLRAAGGTLVAATGATAGSSEAESMPIRTLIKRLSSQENKLIDEAATKDGVLNKNQAAAVKAEALRIKNTYPTGDGWLPIGVNPGGTAPSFKMDKKGNIKIKWLQPSYQFHLPPNYVGSSKKPNAEEIASHREDLTNRMLDDVQDVVDRAKNGDQAAKDIIGQANWYRTMRTRLRKEFGGMGDVFADLLGATSAQTLVQANYDNSLIVLRRFVRGEFDSEIAAYQKMVADGEPLDQKTLTALHKDKSSPFQLIRKAGGELFNTNSPAATGALLDMFRQIKVGQAPKTINFTGNLIGYGNDATVDVWAARYLRDIAGLPRIPPPAEKAVAGKHLTESTLDDPKIGGEFGFGQNVFEEAAKQLNASGIIGDIDPNLGEIGPDDLQAVIWFLEKEKWTKNGWTSKGGEGGSLDFESDFGGSADRARVSELRSSINQKFTPPKRRKKETDAEYEGRIEEARLQNQSDKEAAAEEMEMLKGSPERFVGGVAMERPGQVPTNSEQAQLASEVTAPLQADDTVIGFQANNTYGEFMGSTERSLNYEVVAQVNFDPMPMTKALVEAGKKYNQDAVFVSKVVPDDAPNARPGGEVYFRDRQGVDFVQKITAILKKYDIDGFTYVTDARQSDRASVQAGTDDQTAGLTGIRFQYIPEFAGTAKDPNLQTIMDEAALTFSEAMREIMGIDGITYSDLVYYDTKVYANPDVDYVVGATSYEEVGTSAGSNVSQVRQGRQDGSAVKSADSGG